MEERYQHNESLIHQLRGNLIQIQHAESSLLKQSELENHFEELLSKKSDTEHRN